jgi:hypothetical protein
MCATDRQDVRGPAAAPAAARGRGAPATLPVRPTAPGLTLAVLTLAAGDAAGAGLPPPQPASAAAAAAPTAAAAHRPIIDGTTKR